MKKNRHRGQLPAAGYCGIATFTTDLCESLGRGVFRMRLFFAVPVNDIEAATNYPPRVRFELRQNDLTSYRQAADFFECQ